MQDIEKVLLITWHFEQFDWLCSLFSSVFLYWVVKIDENYEHRQNIFKKKIWNWNYILWNRK